MDLGGRTSKIYLLKKYLYKMCVLFNFPPLIKVIFSHVRLFMIISHVTIIADSVTCDDFADLMLFLQGNGAIFHIINRIIHGCLEICVGNDISLVRFAHL